MKQLSVVAMSRMLRRITGRRVAAALLAAPLVLPASAAASAGLFTPGGSIALTAAAAGSNPPGAEGLSAGGGTVLVADTPHQATASYSTQTLSPVSPFLSDFTGTPNRIFSQPWDAITDGMGRIDVSDPALAQVLILSPSNGQEWGSFMTTGVTGLSAFAPHQLASDPTGAKVAIADTGDNAIDVFSTGGTLQSQITGPAGSTLSAPQGVAYDSAGNLWVADTGNHRLVKFDPSGTLLAAYGSSGNGDVQFGPGSPTTLATDAFRNLWVADPGNDRVQWINVTRSSTSATLQGEWSTWSTATGLDSLAAPAGVSVDPGNGDLWVSDTGHDRVVRFRLPGVGAAASAPTLVTAASAWLHGTVTTNDGPWKCHFVYRVSGTATWTATGDACGKSQSYLAATQLTSLQPSTQYDYALVASRPDGSGAATSPTQTFMTAPAAGTTSGTAPVATTMQPSYTSSTELDLAGSILDAGGLDTHYYFQWGPSLLSMPNDSPALPGTDVGSGATPASPSLATATLTGLTPGTTYCFRLVAVNSAGTTYAHDAGSGDPGTNRGLCATTAGAPTGSGGGGSTTGTGGGSTGGTPSAPPAPSPAPGPSPKSYPTQFFPGCYPSENYAAPNWAGFWLLQARLTTGPGITKLHFHIDGPTPGSGYDTPDKLVSLQSNGPSLVVDTVGYRSVADSTVWWDGLAYNQRYAYWAVATTTLGSHTTVITTRLAPCHFLTPPSADSDAGADGGGKADANPDGDADDPNPADDAMPAPTTPVPNPSGNSSGTSGTVPITNADGVVVAWFSVGPSGFAGTAEDRVAEAARDSAARRVTPAPIVVTKVWRHVHRGSLHYALSFSRRARAQIRALIRARRHPVGIVRIDVSYPHGARHVYTARIAIRS